jgi:hypothetical protein
VAGLSICQKVVTIAPYVGTQNNVSEVNTMTKDNKPKTLIFGMDVKEEEEKSPKKTSTAEEPKKKVVLKKKKNKNDETSFF